MNAPTVVTKTVEHAEASRLPDTSWLFRRLLVYAICIGALWVIIRTTEWMIDVAETRRPVDWPTVRFNLRYAYWLLGGTLTLYCVGASIEEVTRLVGAIRTTRKETTTTAAAPPATVRADGATVVAGAPEEPADAGELPPDMRVRL